MSLSTDEPTGTVLDTRDLLRVATAGSVDDGKSTLIGRLLLDSKQLLDDQAEDLDLNDLAHLTDGLRAEREQGITIDVAYRFFATPVRSFILADTPGHVQYTRNMVTGASTADLALVLVDARTGVIEQSRRHTVLANLLGIRHVVVCVNKMDLVDYAEARFDAVASEVRALAAGLEIPDVTVLPICALAGDNVVERSANMPWYDGPPLLEHLETVEVAEDRNLDDVRFPVQSVILPRDRSGAGGEYRGYAGQVAAGVLRPGDEVVVLPQGVRTRIRALDTLDGPVDVAFPPMAVTVLLEDEVDVGRGDLVAGPADAPVPSREIEATVCWMADAPLRPGGRYKLKQTTRTVPAMVQSIERRLDVSTLTDEPAEALGLNDIGDVVVRTGSPVMADPYEQSRATGAFILIDEQTHATVGAGMVRRTSEGPRSAPRSRDVVWHAGGLDRADRWRALDTRGATIWLTGLPASGKSTIGRLVEQRLVEAGRSAYLLDGDNIRHGLSGDLGFDRAARSENVRRVAHVARLLADAGTIALVSLVSPFREDRALARRLHDVADLPFLEAWVDTPVEECARRDPKGLYARARAGRMPDLTGDGSPYEAPEDPDIRLRAADVPLEQCVDELLARIDALLGER